MDRQATILDRSGPPYIWALLDEEVLDDCYGGPEVMDPQRHHLLDLMERPNVSVRFLTRSAGAHLGLDGPFRIISIEGRDIAYAGARRGGRLIEMPGEVADFRIDFDRLGHKAASDDSSRELVQRRLEAMG
jgi:hypothetical protein